MSHGILLVDKPEGWRSRQVVDAIGKRFRIRKIGHAGTLDPLATGLLVLLLGEGTKLSRYVMDGRKRYTATIRLGVETDTYDSEGEVLAEHDTSHLDPAGVERALAGFVGTQLQRPPGYAAIKVDGKPLYKYARAGETVEAEAREITIHELRVPRIELPFVEIEVACSKGTYMRSIAHDLGEQLGVGGHLTAIRRIESAPHHVSDASPLDELLDLEPENFAERVVGLADALPHLPRIEAGGELIQRVANGMPIPGELIYGRVPLELQRGDVVQIMTPTRLALLEVAQAPAELGPPPWSGTTPLRYQRVLHLA